MNDRIPKPTTKLIAAALRHRVLSLSPNDVEWDQTEKSAYLGGVIEFTHDTRVHSLVLLIDGSVSLYDSDGHGSLGCGDHPEVRSAATALLESLEALIPGSDAALNWDAPAAGGLSCHLLLVDGRRLVEAKLESLGHTPPLRELYFSAQSLVALIERVRAGQSLSDEIELACSTMAAEEDEQCWSVGSVAHRLRI